MSKAEESSTHSFIMSQKVGDQFGGIYYVESAYVKLTAQQKKYTDLMLRDRSGSRNVKFWGVIEKLTAGSFVAIIARVEDYQGAPSITTNEVEVVEEPEDLSSYIPIFDNLDDWKSNLSELIDFVASKRNVDAQETCLLLLREVFNPSGNLYQRFVESPSGSLPYYGRVGGLLVNTVNVTRAAIGLANQHSLNDTEYTLLVTSALVHRLGAIDSFAFEHCVPRATKKGLLLGLGNLTFNRLSTVIRKLVQDAKGNGKTLSQEAILRVLHAVIAHDGKAVKPMTKEAIVLSLAVQSDGELAESFDFIANDQNGGEEFTAYDPRRGVRYYRG